MKANDKAITSPINNITAFLKHLKTITQIIIIILMNENELKYHASPWGKLINSYLQSNYSKEYFKVINLTLTAGQWEISSL